MHAMYGNQALASAIRVTKFQFVIWIHSLKLEDTVEIANLLRKYSKIVFK